MLAALVVAVMPARLYFVLIANATYVSAESGTGGGEIVVAKIEKMRWNNKMSAGTTNFIILW